jgi:hypothetical protein
MDDLRKIKSVPLEYLAHSEHREVFRDGDELVPSTDGLMQAHLRFPGGKPFTVHVTQEVFREFFLPRLQSPEVNALDEKLRDAVDLVSADPDFRIFTGPRP